MQTNHSRDLSDAQWALLGGRARAALAVDDLKGGIPEDNAFGLNRFDNFEASRANGSRLMAGDRDSLENLRFPTKVLNELAIALGPDLANAEWHRKREIIRRLVQQIDMGQEIITIHFRVSQNARASDSISVRLFRR